jgi:hypothetical protein
VYTKKLVLIAIIILVAAVLTAGVTYAQSQTPNLTQSSNTIISDQIRQSNCHKDSTATMHDTCPDNNTLQIDEVCPNGGHSQTGSDCAYSDHDLQNDCNTIDGYHSGMMGQRIGGHHRGGHHR